MKKRILLTLSIPAILATSALGDLGSKKDVIIGSQSSIHQGRHIQPNQVQSHYGGIVNSIGTDGYNIEANANKDGKKNWRYDEGETSVSFRITDAAPTSAPASTPTPVPTTTPRPTSTPATATPRPVITAAPRPISSGKMAISSTSYYNFGVNKPFRKKAGAHKNYPVDLPYEYHFYSGSRPTTGIAGGSFLYNGKLYRLGSVSGNIAAGYSCTSMGRYYSYRNTTIRDSSGKAIATYPASSFPSKSVSKCVKGTLIKFAS